MRKRIFSIFLAVAMIFCIIPLSAYADEHQHTFENKHGYDFSNLPEGYSIPCKIYESPCSSECGYSLYSWDVFGLSGQFVDKTGTSGLVVYRHYREWFEKIYGRNATAKKYETGGGSAGTGGAGRNPSGYSGTGVPTYNADGEYQITVYPSLSPVGSSYLEDYPVDTTYNTNYASWNISGLTVSGRAVGTRSDRLTMAYAYKIVKPSISGLYYIKTKQYTATHWLDSDLKTFCSYSIAANSYSSNLSSISTAESIIKSGNVLCYVAKPPNANSSVTFYFHPIVVTVIPNKSSVKQQTNITINNNTWNGNIYQDNSTNLTYIYPQYTTINENNETVTNISNNPIIYNNETKQYYTYDSVTNNYYYITYETPTPSPSPDPGTDPTPTPEPGEDTGDTSGIMKILQEIKAVLVSGFAGITEKLQNIGVGGSTPEAAKPGSSSGNKGQSWWDKLLSKIGDAIIDGLLGAISAVLKLIFKLFTTILGWIIWLVSQVLPLFPFLPPGLGALLIGGVVVCFIIGLIKFIRG